MDGTERPSLPFTQLEYVKMRETVPSTPLAACLWLSGRHLLVESQEVSSTSGVNSCARVMRSMLQYFSAHLKNVQTKLTINVLVLTIRLDVRFGM